jgi:hypothetical protein
VGYLRTDEAQILIKFDVLVARAAWLTCARCPAVFSVLRYFTDTVYMV